MSTLPVLTPQPGRQTVPRRAADLLVEALPELGIALCLGIPGGAVSPVYDALLDTDQVRVVQTRHESSAVFAAAAYGRQTGKVSLVLVTSGPGVLNTVNALASASRDGLPLVVLAGEVPRARQGRGALQDGSAHDLDIAGVMRSVVKHVHPVTSAEALVPALHDAVRRALTAPQGPVVLTASPDLLSATVTPTRVLPVADSPASLPDISEVVQALDEASEVLIFAGSGCRAEPGPDALLALAERLGAPVVTSPKAKGVFPESHALARGIHGVGGHPSATEALAGSPDVLLVLGSSLGELATSGWSPRMREVTTIIQVDPNGLVAGRSVPVTISVPTTVHVFAASVLPALRRPPTTPPPGRLRRLPRGQSHSELLHPVDVVRELQHAMPPGTAWAVDSGEHTFAALQHLVIDDPTAWLAMLGLGSMGSGIAGALGLALAEPQRPVGCICGDGGMLMTLGELATAAAEGLRVRWFVFDDGRLGMVAHGHNALFGRTHPFTTEPGDLASVAEALGVRAHVVRSAGDLIDLSAALAEHDGPMLLDILIDPEPAMPKGGRLSTLSDNREEAS